MAAAAGSSGRWRRTEVVGPFTAAVTGVASSAAGVVEASSAIAEGACQAAGVGPYQANQVGAYRTNLVVVVGALCPEPPSAPSATALSTLQ